MSSYKLLIAEDEGLIARDIANRLTSLGHQVVDTVETGEDAVVNAAGVDLVLMDIRLDGTMDGVEAAAKIRDLYRIPVIFLTAHADRATIERAKLTDPYGYLVKPLAQATLQSTIEIAIYRHRMEREVAIREAWLSAVLGSISDAVVSTDAQGNIRMMNRAAEVLTGWTQPDVAGRLCSEVVSLVDPESGDPAGDPLPLAILGDTSVPLGNHVQLKVKDGRRLMVEGAIAPVKAGGEFLGAVQTFRDVTARRWEERQIRQAQKTEAAGRLAAAVAEEYANLLAIIRNQAGQLLQQFAGYRGVREPLTEIQQATSAAEQITRRLAGFSGRETGRRESMSLNGLVRRMAKPIEAVSGARVSVAIRLAPATGKVMADSAQLEQMVMNLAVHSCGAMRDGGRLLVETANVLLPKGEFVRLNVTQLPHLIEQPQDLEKAQGGSTVNLEALFDPSEQENLGLSVARVIAVEHGGYLSAQPVEDNGVRFEVLLPQWSEPVAIHRAESFTPPSVILIDPSEPVRRHLHNFFETNGYNLLEAADADEAHSLCEMQGSLPDLVIADAPEASKFSVGYPTIAVLRMVNGEAGEGEIARPFTQAALLKRVSTTIEHGRARGVQASMP